MMTKIFRDSKEPLYKRQNRFMNIKAFRPSVLKKIMNDNAPDYSKDDLLALYSFTGGVAKYVQLLIEDHAFTVDSMIDSIVSSDSAFISEGRAILVEEFGKDYDTYFSILSAISSGYTRRAEIESIVGKEIGGYLTRLEDDYGIIRKDEEFARNEDVSFLVIDFSKAPKDIFDLFDHYIHNLDELFQRLQLFYNTTFKERKSIIIFDEVQFCPQERASHLFIQTSDM